MLSGLDPYLFSRNMDPAFFFIYPAVNQCCGAGAGAGGAEIILGYWSRRRSPYKIFRLRLHGSGVEIIIVINILLGTVYCRQFEGCLDK